MKIPVNMAQMFDMNPERPSVLTQPIPGDYYDTTPDHTREQVEKFGALMSALPKGDGFISGAEVVERMKDLIGGDPSTLVIVDSFSPMT
jgi:hypothetical protein